MNIRIRFGHCLETKPNVVDRSAINRFEKTLDRGAIHDNLRNGNPPRQQGSALDSAKLWHTPRLPRLTPKLATLHRRTGPSLIEVILAIAILGASMVVIGELFNLGLRSAFQARMRSEANILCDSKMAELAAGVIPATSSGNQTVTESPSWDYSIDVASADQPGLLIATVTLTQNDSTVTSPVALSIVRFIPDPDYEPEQ